MKKYDMSEIMKRAWQEYRSNQRGKIYNYETGKLEAKVYTFSAALKWAWAVEKEIAALEERKNTMTVAEKIEAIENSLFALKMKDRWSDSDSEQYDNLNKELNRLNAA